jgi:hypothetical protein
MGGGVILAIDHACALLGQTMRPVTPQQKKAAAASALAAAYSEEGEPGSEMLAEARRRLGDWPHVLPYAVGLAPPPPPTDPSRMCWRRLASVAKGVPDCVHGYAAVGLPPGSAVAVLTERGCKLRAALGSAQPRQFSAWDMADRLQRVERARVALKVEKDCEKRLAELAREYEVAREPFPPPVCSGGPFADSNGILRGGCPRCGCCPGFELPRLAHAPHLLLRCVHCGCDAKEHEEIRTEAERRAERDDDILKNHVWE